MTEKENEAAWQQYHDALDIYTKKKREAMDKWEDQVGSKLWEKVMMFKAKHSSIRNSKPV